MSTIYTARVTVRSGRDGSVRSDDSALSAPLAFPKGMGGDGKGTNPEQLLAAGYAACFGSTLRAIAKASHKTLEDVVLLAEVDVLAEAGVYDLAIRVAVSAKGADEATLRDLVEKAKVACPYSRALRDSIATTITVAAG